MRLRFLLWLSLVFLPGPATADDIPYVFNESSHDIGKYDSDQLINISESSPELEGVPPISETKDSDILLFPDSRTYKTVGEVRSEFDYKVWQKEGQVLFRQGRYDEALQAFDQSIQINPKYADSWNDKGFVLLVTRRYDEALECFDVAIALEPSFVRAWDNKAEVLYLMGRYDEAIIACDATIQLDPMSADTWYIKALTLKAKSDAAFSRAEELT